MSRPLIFIVLLVAFGLAMVGTAFAHDPDHPEIDQWYAGLMRPDQPTLSCCGEADAYWADEIHVRDGKVYAVITDDRDNVSLHRRAVPVGTEIEIPPEKLKWDRGNPTGHSVVFLSSSLYPFCFVQGTGI